MNSRDLKSEFTDVYRKFFFENSIVISMPFIMTWSGDYSSHFNWINIKQKIPLRVYVGISSYTGIGVKLWKINYYNPGEKLFIEDDMSNYSDHFRNIEKNLNEVLSVDIGKWLILSVLSELPWNIGLGFESIFWMLISLWLERVKGGITCHKIEEIKGKNLNDAWINYQDILSPLFNASYWYLIGSYKSYPITGDISTSFYDGSHPFVALSISQHFQGDYEKIIRGWGWAQVFRFNELVSEIDDHSHLPIDYGIIYSGQPIVTYQIIHANTHTLDWVQEAKGYLSMVFHTFLNEEWSQISLQYKNILDSKNHKFENAHSDLMLVISFEIFNFMRKIYEKWFSEENIAMFLFAVNKIRYSNYIRYFSKWFFNFINEIEKQVWLPSILALSPNDTTVMWGTINFAVPLEKYRTNIRSWIKRTQMIHEWSYTIYENWADWIEEKGVIFEQDIEFGLLSQFFLKKSFILRRSSWETMAFDWNDLDSLKNNEEILIDKIRNKILINGEYMTSKDLISQSATIEVLNHLLDWKWKEIQSRDLIVSSYSQNKNEMFSKILNPFKKLILKKIGKQISIFCTGSTEDFCLKIDLGTVKISTFGKISW